LEVGLLDYDSQGRDVHALKNAGPARAKTQPEANYSPARPGSARGVKTMTSHMTLALLLALGKFSKGQIPLRYLARELVCELLCDQLASWIA